MKFKKYDFVRIIALNSDHHTPEEFLGAVGMVIGRHEHSNEFNIEICIFDQELQEYAMDLGIDYWDKSELEWY